MDMPHRFFSFGRIAAITLNTLTELTRQKAFYVLLIFALLLIGSSIFMARLTFQQEFQILKDVSLGAMSIFTSLLAIVATARLIPKDVEDCTVYTILAKPVPRFEYVLACQAGAAFRVRARQARRCPVAARDQHPGHERDVSRGALHARTSYVAPNIEPDVRRAARAS